ncbi:MAG TPA: hypothetical protein VF145_12485 [Chitinophagaceae bacterium]
MPVRFQHSDEASLYFITFTCFEWLPLFQVTNSYDLIYRWFEYLKKKKKIQVTGFVIMPNHLHSIFFFPEKGFSLNKIIGNGKRFIAYDALRRLQSQNEDKILARLSEAVSNNEKNKGQLHKFFNDSFDAKPIESEWFFYQKLEYMHLNPVRGKYNLVDDWREYEHSSASFYELNKVYHFTPVHYMDLG